MYFAQAFAAVVEIDDVGPVQPRRRREITFPIARIPFGLLVDENVVPGGMIRDPDEDDAHVPLVRRFDEVLEIIQGPELGIQAVIILDGIGTEEDPRGAECQRGATVVRRAGPQRTDPRTAGCGHGIENERTVWLKWKDVDLDANEISVVRSIVMQVTGPCKTESSQKPVPLDPYLAAALQAWRQQAKYSGPEDWVFASPSVNGRRPYWGQQIMRKVIRPISIRVGITKRIGWHTFRHTYSTLLRATRVDIKVMQELLRHASRRVTMDTYTQAVTAQKRKKQSRVIRLFRVRAIVPATEV